MQPSDELLHWLFEGISNGLLSIKDGAAIIDMQVLEFSMKMEEISNLNEDMMVYHHQMSDSKILQDFWDGPLREEHGFWVLEILNYHVRFFPDGRYEIWDTTQGYVVEEENRASVQAACRSVNSWFIKELSELLVWFKDGENK